MVTSDILIGRKYVSGGYSTSFSPGYTLKKPMFAPCDIKLFDMNLNSNGDLKQCEHECLKHESRMGNVVC